MYRPKVTVHEDDRGRFIQVWRGKDFEAINFLEIRTGVTRGHHYHKRNHELMVVTRGRLRLRVEGRKTGEATEHVLEQGDCVVIEPYDLHTLTAEEDSSLVACNTVAPYAEGRPDVFEA
jgi:UDP-2-acetamido-2,6-beta-L-arabino-hexul-4-ose reductase